MKKEELFDLLEHIDDKYIEEAMYEEFDEARPVEIRAGKTRIAPIKIAASIAACLAVAIGAGLIISNLKKPAVKPYDSVELTLSEKDFVTYCQKIVSDESDLISQKKTTWQTRKLDVDFDGEDEYLICPQIDEATLPEIGVRVFRKTENGAEDLGSFGNYSEHIDLDAIRKDERDGVYNQYYYCVANNVDGVKYDGIRFLFYCTDDGKMHGDKHLLRVTEARWASAPEVLLTEGTLKDDRYVGSEQVFIKEIKDFPDDVADTFCEFNKDEIAKCESDALERNSKTELADMLTSGMWHTGEYDINNDGEKELLVSLFNFSNMKGVFVYNKDCEFLGSFDTEEGLCDPELLHYNSEENFWYYCGIECTNKRGEAGDSTRPERASINKLIVDKNSFSTERLMHYDMIWNDDTTDSFDHDVYWIGDKEVDEKEYREASHNYDTMGMGSRNFDLTDPNEWKYSSRFEDSALTGTGSGLDSLRPFIDFNEDTYTIKAGPVEYLPLDNDKIPVVKYPPDPFDSEGAYNAVISSKKYGDYTIYLIGEHMYKLSDSGDICARNLLVVLGKNKEGIWVDNITTQDNTVNPDDIMIRILEFDSGDIIAFRFADGMTYFFRITTNGKIEPVCPRESYDNSVKLSDDFRVEGDAIIDKNFDHPFNFDFE